MNNQEIIDIIEEKEKSPLKNFLINVFDIVAFLVFVLGIVLIIRIFLFNPFTVVGDSMDPTFKESDFIVIDKVSPRFSDYERWDIIVFLPPWKNVNYIKRIVGMPWETVKLNDWYVYICKNDDTWKNCERLKEDYLPEQWQTKAECWINEFHVWSWSYFVLWDNRNQSTDSRCCFGLWCFEWTQKNYTLQESDMLGKVFVRIFPDFSRF